MNFKIKKKKKVLVTGGTGFIAGWIIKHLVEEGVTVHATVRDPDDKQKIAHLVKLSENNPGEIILFKADLLERGSFNAAIYGDADECEYAPNNTLTEAIWNNTSSPSHQPYSYSKTIAEREAWKLADAQMRWSLVVINPPVVLGPTVSGKSTSASHDICLQLGDGTMKSGAPPFEVGMVDVRDVADAHIRAAYISKAAGRHIVFKETTTPLKLSQMLQEKYGQKYPLPTKELPKWLVWLVGPLLDKTMTRRLIAKNMGHKWRADNSKSKEELGIEYRSLDTSINEMFQQMIDQGYIKSL